MCTAEPDSPYRKAVYVYTSWLQYKKCRRIFGGRAELQAEFNAERLPYDGPIGSGLTTETI